MSKVNKNMAVLVVSCDQYHDVWNTFFELFFMHWPDCPYPVYLGTNERNYSFPDRLVNVIKTGKDLSWTENYRYMLSAIPEEYVLTFLDDFLICSRIPTNRVAKALNICINRKIDCLRLIPKPRGHEQLNGLAEYKIISPLDEYCINTQIAIWKKSTLNTLLAGRRSAWEFEIMNSKNCRNTKTLPGLFVSCRVPLVSIKNGICQGKWVRDSIRFCVSQGIPIDLKHRALQSVHEGIIDQIKCKVRGVLPVGIKRQVKLSLTTLGLGHLFVNKEV